jgi:hypothetical protein
MISVDVNVDKIQSSIETMLNMIAVLTTNTFTNDSNLSIVSNNLGIPLTGSIASGFMLGITRRG